MTDEYSRRVGDDRLLRLEHGYDEMRLQIQKLIDEVKNQGGNTEHLIMLMQRVLDRQEKLISGDPSEGLIGFSIRIDRTEQTLKDWKWHIRLIWATIIGLVAKVLLDFFTQR